MNKTADFVRRQWRTSLWFFRIFPFWIALIAGLNIWSDFSNGQPLDWRNIIWPAAMLVFAALLYVFMRLIFKGVLRYSERRDRQP